MDTTRHPSAWRKVRISRETHAEAHLVPRFEPEEAHSLDWFCGCLPRVWRVLAERLLVFEHRSDIQRDVCVPDKLPEKL